MIEIVKVSKGEYAFRNLDSGHLVCNQDGTAKKARTKMGAFRTRNKLIRQLDEFITQHVR